MHCEDGRSMYLVYPKLPDYTDWVKVHVVPQLYLLPKKVVACQARHLKLPLTIWGPKRARSRPAPNT